MPTKKTKKATEAKVVSITKNEAPMSLERATNQLKSVVTYISSMMGPDATVDQVAAAFDACKALEKNTEFLTKLARDQVLSRLKQDGEPTEEGGFTLEHNGWRLRATRTHKGLDPKKVEARLRELQTDPALYMTPTVSYKLNPNREDALRKFLGEERIAECGYDERYQVASPEQVETEEWSSVNE